MTIYYNYLKIIPTKLNNIQIYFIMILFEKAEYKSVSVEYYFFFKFCLILNERPETRILCHKI